MRRMGACQSTLNGNSTLDNTNSTLDFREKRMVEWTVTDVKHWLLFVCDGEFKSLAPIFKQNDINGQRLKNITDQEIKRLIKNTFIATRFRLIRNAQMTILEDKNEINANSHYRKTPRGIDSDKNRSERYVLLKCSLLLPSQTELLVSGYIHTLQFKEKSIELNYPIPDGIIHIIIEYCFKSRFVLN